MSTDLSRTVCHEGLQEWVSVASGWVAGGLLMIRSFVIIWSENG
jgi:hypothetical protein